MAQVKEMAKLDGGDVFPALQFSVLDGGKCNFPGDFEGQWSVLLLYRGEW